MMIWVSFLNIFKFFVVFEIFYVLWFLKYFMFFGFLLYNMCYCHRCREGSSTWDVSIAPMWA
jgi:hypothetical protein